MTQTFCLIKTTHNRYWYQELAHQNSLAPGKFEWNFRHVIFKQILVIDRWGISCEIALIWMSLDFTDDQSTLVQVMAWCHQATSHCLSQGWLSSLSPCGVTRPQWVKARYRVSFLSSKSWHHFNIKISPYQYWKSHSRDWTTVQTWSSQWDFLYW